MTKSPSGFLQSEAILARNLFGATPADAVKFSSTRIWSRIVRATCVAVGKPILFSETSRYASSRDRGSTRSVWRLKISCAWRETARYRGKSGGRKTALGQRRSARTAGMAERTPNFRASYEAAHTTERFPRHATTTGL